MVIGSQINDGAIYPLSRYKSKNLAQRMWDKVRCYWEQVGEHIENLGNMFENTYENPKKIQHPSFSPPTPSCLDACTFIKKCLFILSIHWVKFKPKILCSNPTTSMHSHFLMGRVNEPLTSSDQLGDKQFELKGSIFSSLLDGPIHI